MYERCEEYEDGTRRICMKDVKNMKKEQNAHT